MTSEVLRVQFVIDSLEPGGAETSLAVMLPPLRERGIEGSVVHFGDSSDISARLEAGGTPVRRIEASGRLERVRLVAEHIRATAPVIVHTTLFEADVAGRIAARRARVPVVSSLVTMQYTDDRRLTEEVPRWKLEGARAFDFATSRLVTRFHAITHAAAEHAIERLRLPRDRIEVIPRGRDAAALGRRTSARRTEGREALDVGDDEVVLLAVARQEPPKGLAVAVAALASLRDRGLPVRLIVAGREGRATSAIRESADRAGVRAHVDLLGHRTDVADLFCAADVFVFPSLWEGLGGALIEAMALEVPIVASDLAPVREIAPQDEVATLVRPGDPHALSEAIARTLAEPDATSARVQRARHRFEQRFTIDVVADAMNAFYRRVAEAR